MKYLKRGLLGKGCGFLLLMPHIFSVAAAQDLLQTYQQALHHSPSWKASQFRYRAAEKKQDISAAKLRPEIELLIKKGFSEQRSPIIPNDVSGPQFKDSFNAQSASLALKQPLIDFQSWYRYQQSKPKLSVSKTALAAARQDLTLDVVIAYFNVLRAAIGVASTERENQAVKSELEKARQRHSAGVVSLTDVEEALAVYDLSQVNKILAKNTLGLAAEELRVLTGTRNETLHSLRDSYPVVLPKEPLATWASLAQENNFKVRMSKLQLETAQLEKKVQKALHLPRLDLLAHYSRASATGGFFPHSEYSDIIFQANLPLYSGGRVHAKAKQAYYGELEQKQLLQQALRRAAQDTQKLYRTVEADVQRVKARNQAIKSSRSALMASQQGYKEGTRNVVDVLQAQRRYFNAKRDYGYARIDYVVNYFRLRHSAGVLKEDNLVSINQFLQAHRAMGLDAPDNLGP